MRIKNLAGEIRVELEPDTAVPFNLKLHTERGEIFARITYRPGESDHQLQLNDTFASFIVPSANRFAFACSSMARFSNCSETTRPPSPTASTKYPAHPCA